jgi:hypothetical protein
MALTKYCSKPSNSTIYGTFSNYHTLCGVTVYLRVLFIYVYTTLMGIFSRIMHNSCSPTQILPKPGPPLQGGWSLQHWFFKITPLVCKKSVLGNNAQNEGPQKTASAQITVPLLCENRPNSLAI